MKTNYHKIRSDQSLSRVRLFATPGRKALQEKSTILLAQDAVVEDGEDAAVAAGADEPPEALLEGNDGFGNLVFSKSVVAVLLQPADARAHHRVGRDGERQPVD